MNDVNTLFIFVGSQFVSFLLTYLIEFTYRLLQHVKNVTENINLRASIVKKIGTYMHSAQYVITKERMRKIQLEYYLSVCLISELINMMPYFYAESANHPYLLSK